MSAQLMVSRTIKVYVNESLWDSLSDDELMALSDSFDATVDSALRAVVAHVQEVHPETLVVQE